MKITRLALLFGAMTLAAISARAIPVTINWNTGFLDGGNIGDGGPGWWDTRTLSAIPENSILDVDVFLEISGGFNGDYYVYLTHSSGFSVLLDRVGRSGANVFGYEDPGLNVTLSDQAINGDIHLYGGNGGNPLTGIWQPDGRNVADPALGLDTDPRTRLLNQFNGLNPNGEWTLFVADLSNGEAGTVKSWGLQITAETINVGVPDGGSTLVLLGIGLMGLGWVRHMRRKH